MFLLAPFTSRAAEKASHVILGQPRRTDNKSAKPSTTTIIVGTISGHPLDPQIGLELH